MHHLVSGPLAFTVLLAALPAQVEPPAPGSPREQFAARLLGTTPWPERIEVRGKILVVADFVATLWREDVPGDQLARRLLEDLLVAMLTEELRHQKAWVSDADYEAAYETYAAPYDKTPFTVEVLAKRFKGYPDLATFQRRWRVVHSFARANKLLDPALADLEAEAARSHDLLKGSAVHAEIWMHTAQPDAEGRRDFAAAEQQARETLARLATGTEAEKLPDGVTFLRPGTDGRALLNPLRTALGEGEYAALHQGLVADALFAAEPGKLLGPLRGTTGWCIARVARREVGQGKVDVSKANTKELLRPLLEERRFHAWVDEVLTGTGIRIDGRPLVAAPAAAAGEAGKAK